MLLSVHALYRNRNSKNKILGLQPLLQTMEVIKTTVMWGLSLSYGPTHLFLSGVCLGVGNILYIN